MPHFCQRFIPSGLKACEDEKLRSKLLSLKLQALVKSGEERATDEALDTFSQVMLLLNALFLFCSLGYFAFKFQQQNLKDGQ